MTRKALTPEEEYPDHATNHRRCTRCNVIYHKDDWRCPQCRNPEFSVPLKTEVAATPPITRDI